MEISFYPSREEVDAAAERDDPLIAVISFDGKSAIAAPAMESGEHHILLQQNNIRSTDIDRYFRIVFDRESADWTFICPPDYKGLAMDEERRVGAFYRDGFSLISEFLEEMGYIVGIRIPRRYSVKFRYTSKNKQT